MSLYLVPPTMRARHHETGEWHVLHLHDWHADGELYCPWDDYVHEDFVDEPHYVNLFEYDQFEATQ